jgi:hypothetical protein
MHKNRGIFSIFDYTLRIMTAIRKRLIEEINNASESTVKDLYKLHTLVKEERNNDTNWLALTESQKESIEMSLQQLNEGKGIPIKKAMTQLTKKYGLT